MHVSYWKRVYQCENYNNLLIDSCLIINHRCFLYHYLCHSSVFVENVAVLPSLHELLDADMRLEAQGRTGPLHAPADAESGAALFQSQVPVAGGQTEACHGTQLK